MAMRHANRNRANARRRALLTAPVALLARPAPGQGAWPPRPVRIVVPFPPGGPADILGRLLAERLAGPWGQPVIVENRPGAAGNLGTAAVARMAPDGLTLLLVASSHVQGAALYRALPFDPIRDFTPITMFAYYSLVLVVHPSVPVRSLAEYEAYARAQDGALTVASAGVGTPTHLASELFRIRSGVPWTAVPFQGAAPAHTAVLSGQVQSLFSNPILAAPAVRDGSFRGIATTGLARAAQLPELPTIAESGYPGFEAGTWYALLAPAGLPPDLAERIHADVQRALAPPEMRARFAAQSLEPRDLGPQALAALMREELARWTEVIRTLGIRAD
jgi:tripartite-type tricarboxylate transporter receptor subunit TctC